MFMLSHAKNAFDSDGVSYRLSVRTTALSVTISAEICHQMSPTLKSTEVGHFKQNFGTKSIADVNQILTRSEGAMGLSYAK